MQTGLQLRAPSFYSVCVGIAGALQVVARPRVLVARAETPDGVLELHERDGAFLLTLAGRVLMNSRASRSERALAELALDALPARRDARVLVGGLGMGLTLAAALRRLDADASVVVSELHPALVEWCRGPLAAQNARALLDPRVEVRFEDVRDSLRRAAEDGPVFDAIVLDLYEGPAATGGDRDPLYGRSACKRLRAALAPSGVLAVWGEAPSRAFERRLRAADFDVSVHRPGRGGLRHAVTVATARRPRPGR